MKKVLIGIGIFLVVIIATAIILPIAYKGKIIEIAKREANANLNAKVDFSDIGLSLITSFPDFRLSMDDFSVIGIGEFEGDTLVYINSLKFDLDLMSVISGNEISVNTIILDKPVVNALVNENEAANWDIVPESADTSTAEEASESNEYKIALKSFKIDGGKIVYDDKAGGIQAILSNLDLSLSGDMTADQTNLDLNIDCKSLDVLMDGIKYMNKTHLKYDAGIDADLANSKYTFKENELGLNDLGLGFDGWVAMPGEDIDMDLTFNAKETSFKSILSLVPAVYAKDFSDVQTEGQVALKGYAKGKYTEELMPAFGINLDVNNAMFKYPDLPKSVDDINLKGEITNPGGVFDNTVINFQQFHFKIAENPVDIKMLIKTPESDPDIDGQINGKISLASLKDVMPMEEGDELTGTIISDIVLKGKTSSLENGQYDKFKADGQLIVMDMDYKSEALPQGAGIKYAKLDFSPQYVELSSFDARSGKSDFKAKGRMENFIAYALKDETLKGNFDLTSQLIDLNEFMTDSGEETTEETEEEGTSDMAVVDVPGNIDFTLTSSIGKLLYDNMEMTNVKGEITIKDKKVKLNPLSMNFLEGKMVLKGTYDVSDVKQPKVNFSANVESFDVSKTVTTLSTVEKLAPIAKYANGKFNTNLSFSTSLDETMNPILSTLQGQGGLLTKNVAVEGFEPINKIAGALKMDKLKKQEFKNVNVNFQFEDGRVKIDPVNWKIGNINSTIAGYSGFDQSLDYVMNLDVPRAAFGGQANSMLDGLVSQANQKGADVNLGETVKLDVLIGGTVTNPTIKTGLKDIAGGIADDLKKRAEEELQRQKEEAEKRAREEAEKLKQQAQQKADSLKNEAEKRAKEEEERLRQEAEKKKKEAEDKAKDEIGKGLKNIFGKPK